MIRTQISITAEQQVGLAKLADERSTSMSAIVRQAVEQVLADATGDPGWTMPFA